MKRTAFDVARDDHTADTAYEADREDRRSCMVCRNLTLRATLSQYGARCSRCYEAYCREPQSSPDVGDKRVNPKAWAWALKARDDAGEQLTPTQRAMYRAVTDREGREATASEADLARTAALKAASAKQVERYAKARGISLESPLEPDDARARFVAESAE